MNLRSNALLYELISMFRNYEQSVYSHRKNYALNLKNMLMCLLKSIVILVWYVFEHYHKHY